MATSRQADIAEGLRSGRIEAEAAAGLLEGAAARVRLVGRFPVGASVELREREGTRFHEGAKIVGRKKVGRDSSVEFTDGVEAGRRYWIVGRVDDELRAVAVTGKVPAPDKPRVERPVPASVRPVQRDEPDWSDGLVVAEAQRGLGIPIVGQEDTAIHPDVERHPGLAQRDVPAGVQQRSATPFGEATPVDPSEHVPEVPQDAIDGKVPQRSDTAQGAAALIPVGEGSPAVRQEDVAKGVQQRSDTRTGEATPIPGDPLTAQFVRDSSEAHAYGDQAIQPTGSPKGTPGEAGTQHLTGKAKLAATTGKATPKRPAKKRAAGPRKPAAKKSGTRRKS